MRSIRDRLELWTEREEEEPYDPIGTFKEMDAPTGSDGKGGTGIFIVHGHDHAALHLLVRVLERSTGRKVIVLHEQANAGRTLIEKFEAHATPAACSGASYSR